MTKARSPSKKGGGAKKPAAPAARPAPSKPAKPASRPAPSSATSSSSASSSTAARPAGKSRAATAGKGGSKAAASKGGNASKGATASKGTPAKTPAGKGSVRLPPIPAAIKAAPKVEAPAKFRREYRRWLDRLISLRHRLLAEGEHLEEEGLKALEQEVSVDHMADYGSDMSEQDTTLALIESKTEALRDVDDAIRRIEVKTYGLCEECEQMIPPGRLELLPHTRYCVKCQEKRERTAG